jgi:hypothetical protein
VPVNRGASATHDAIAEAPSGTRWLLSIEHTGANAAAGNGVAIAIVLALTSAAIAIAVLLNWHPRPFLIGAGLISLAYWVFGEGLGGIFTGSGTDPGAGPLFVLLAAILYSLVDHPTRARLPERKKLPDSGGPLVLAPGPQAFGRGHILTPNGRSPAADGLLKIDGSTYGGSNQ